MIDHIRRIDDTRSVHGFLTVEETILLSERGVTMMDPFSTLVSRQIRLTAGIFIWPNVTILTGENGRISIGSGTVLHSGVRMEANAGSIHVGADCDIGQEGGFTLVAAGNDDAITVGNGARLNGGGSIAIKAEKRKLLWPRGSRDAKSQTAQLSRFSILLSGKGWISFARISTSSLIRCLPCAGIFYQGIQLSVCGTC
ncbi:hypothetical protein [Neorhizobium tomejilense]|uniref:hypothetical protein n=1 Tax=Neorhizobium tomejilense TaxID=2093828 RepID=UPI003ED0449C